MTKLSKFIMGTPKREFEEKYLALRQKEGRIITIEQLRKLPDISGFPHFKEWKIRIRSAKRFIKYLRGQHARVLDVGCGNGWFAYLIAKEGHEVTGVDLNLFELKQATKAFELSNLKFIYDDFLNPSIDRIQYGRFTHILFSSSLQYFRNLEDVLSRSKYLLDGEGEVHIMNTPIYSNNNAIKAKKRSNEYYKTIGMPEFAENYHHHVWEEFEKHQAKQMNRWRFPWKWEFPWLMIKVGK